MGFLSGQILIYTSKRFEDIYIDINKKHGLVYSDIFTMMCSIGFINNRRSERLDKGREFRSNYLKKNQRFTLYTILLEDPEININIEELLGSERQKEFITILEEYAEGGMEVLLEEAFPPNIEINTRSKAYDDYIIDIMNYVKNEYEKVPF